ncbi:MAG TPA: hypothetical protein VKB57_00810 [Acidimicrobiales bacterium]|jgi:hypothetical protein|nr:hypothetical protein [Acidimicrobiales bacterium]
MNSLTLVVTVVQTLAGRLRSARADDRGEINSNVAWAGLMLVVAVTVGGIILAAAEGAAGRFNFGF